MINKVTLVGRLGADPEVRTLESGASVAKVRLATTENYRDKNDQWQEETQWHDVVFWRYNAEKAQQRLHKGSLIYVEGKLTHRKWQDKDGNNRRTTEVLGAMFRSLDRRTEDGGQTSTPNQSQPTAEALSPKPSPAPVDDGDDLPF